MYLDGTILQLSLFWNAKNDNWDECVPKIKLRWRKGVSIGRFFTTTKVIKPYQMYGNSYGGTIITI